MAKTSTKGRESGTRVRGRDRQQETVRNQDNEQGIVRDDRGQVQPADKRRAQLNDGTQQNSGLRAQKEAAENEDDVPSPGEPARGE